MALIVITLQDEEDGTISLGFTPEPTFTEQDDLTPAQSMGVMTLSFIMQSLSGNEETEVA